VHAFEPGAAAVKTMLVMAAHGAAEIGISH